MIRSTRFSSEILVRYNQIFLDLMIPSKISLDQLVDLTDERMELGFQTRVEDQGRSNVLKALP